MSRRDSFWRAVPKESDDAIRWPEHPRQRAELAEQLLGCRLMASLDAVVSDAYRVTGGSPAEDGSVRTPEERTLASSLSGLSGEQRQAVLSLLKRACVQLVSSTFGQLALPSATVSLRVVPHTRSGGPLPAIDLERRQLEAAYVEWIDAFSDHLGAAQ